MIDLTLHFEWAFSNLICSKRSHLKDAYKLFRTVSVKCGPIPKPSTNCGPDLSEIYVPTNWDHIIITIA